MAATPPAHAAPPGTLSWLPWINPWFYLVVSITSSLAAPFLSGIGDSEGFIDGLIVLCFVTLILSLVMSYYSKSLKAIVASSSLFIVFLISSTSYAFQYFDVTTNPEILGEEIDGQSEKVEQVGEDKSRQCSVLDHSVDASRSTDYMINMSWRKYLVYRMKTESKDNIIYYDNYGSAGVYYVFYYGTAKDSISGQIQTVCVEKNANCRILVQPSKGKSKVLEPPLSLNVETPIQQHNDSSARFGITMSAGLVPLTGFSVSNFGISLPIQVSPYHVSEDFGRFEYSCT